MNLDQIGFLSLKNSSSITVEFEKNKFNNRKTQTLIASNKSYIHKHQIEIEKENDTNFDDHKIIRKFFSFFTLFSIAHYSSFIRMNSKKTKNNKEENKRNEFFFLP